ncbi:Uncharacterised protein [Mycobacterium tuberculosis]|uniref:Uncharacterized protein n=1 Tax=Mycobacterium tuberculosis TaxID=1773 RepID=A0A916PHL6_MYCTX|nr:Uncharacterised protein [Mycobacterium tuberculosis]CFR94363.1 Uncharacterised protein [Mycobacterium tuberculosis]CKT95926.1 Uncharacterised protein [Mycobacterium tuberculosis]CKY98696.1 Uncharacterised protein [Mycobacterium tuberculosis]CKZ06767.1 Uncharacterised protein [Mycobacterium tuberculosis]
MIFITTIPHHGAPQCKSQPDTSERSAPAHGCCQLPSADAPTA